MSQLPDEVIGRLRVFGWRLSDLLPPRLHGAIMPYDDKLEAILPGTRCDFAQRSLLHFVTRVLPNALASAVEHAELVAASLSGLSPPAKRTRPRASDEEVSAWIEGAVGMHSGIGRLLRSIREQGIACEQARFSRLYRQVMGDR